MHVGSSSVRWVTPNRLCVGSSVGDPKGLHGGKKNVETPYKTRRKGGRRGRVIKGVPRVTEAPDTDSVRHCNGHYFRSQHRQHNQQVWELTCVW